MRSFFLLFFSSGQFYSHPSSPVHSVMFALDPKNFPLSKLSCKMMLSLQAVLSTNFKLACTLTLPELEIQIMRWMNVTHLQRPSECLATMATRRIRREYSLKFTGQIIITVSVKHFIQRARTEKKVGKKERKDQSPRYLHKQLGINRSMAEVVSC